MADFDHRLLSNAVPLIAVMLMASGIVVKTLPLASKRPVEASDAKIAHAGRQDVHARLWEDPFVVMRDVQGKQPAKRCEEALGDAAHHPGTLARTVQWELKRQGREVTVMPVLVPGGPYSQDSESRRRTRYATVMALLQAKWEPGDEEKLGFVWTFEGCLDAHWTRSMPEILPYEWFTRDGHGKSESMLVLWIDEDAVSRRPLRGMRTLNDLILRGPEVCRLIDSQAPPSDQFTLSRLEPLLPHLEKLCPVASEGSAWRPSGDPQPWTSTVVIGPWSSATLFGLVGEIARGRSDPERQGSQDSATGASPSARPPEPRFYSSAATAPIDDDEFKEALAACNRDRLAAEKRGDTGYANTIECAADADAIRQGFERRVVRLNATDDRLTSAFADELMLRLDSATPLEHRRRAFCTGTVVIVAEGDTRYARAFREDFASKLKERRLKAKACGERKNPSIVQVGYLRGLDGITPGTAVRPVSPGTTPQNPRPGARDSLLEQAALERADGPSQYDYLRRLAVQLVDLDRALRKDGQHGIAAIGILGSDAYDKILVLDALRDRFPQAVFFAADLDARMLDASSVRSTRNLVVASGYGLALNRQLQGSAPPFRDTYQTGTYLSTLVALDSDARQLDTADFDAWFRQARRYEIGRTRPVNLVGAPDGSPEMKVQPESDDCAVPEPMTCRSIHSDEDWRGFDPLPALRAWLAFLVMVAAAAGLAFVLSRTARSVGRELHSYATPAGLGVVAAALAFLGAGLYAIHLNVGTRDGEPFAWLEGVSIWPTQILGLIILVVTCALLVYGRMRLRANIDKVATSFSLSTLGDHERGGAREARFSLKPDSTTHWAGELEAYRSGFGARTVANEWMDFLERMRFGACATRVGLATLLFLAFGIALLSLDWPNSPHRGPSAAWFNHVLQFVLIGSTMALLFSALDASIVASRLLRRILAAPVDPQLLESRLQGTALDYPISEQARGHWVRFRLAVEVAGAVNRLIYLPFVILLLLAPIRSRIFDAWDFSLPYAALLVISLVIAVRCALDLRKQAERLRSHVLTELDHEAEQQEIETGPGATDAATGVGAREASTSSAPPKLHAKLLRRLAADIGAVRAGPFRPFSQEPVVRGLLVVLGGTGGITTAEFLFLAR
jgi:hypothetical protein